MKNRLVLSSIAILLVSIVASACAAAPTPAPAPAAAPPTTRFDVNKFVGTYKGTWTNNAAGTSGPATITIVADQAAKTANLTIDFDGPYLGLIDPPAQTLTAKYDDTMATIQGSNPLFGDYNVTLDGDGNLNGLMKNLAAGVIPEMTYTGKVGDGRLDADYTVKFADGRTANSVLRLVKQ